MTVKISIELDESHRAFAERMVENGTFSSISSVVQAGIEKMMHKDHGNSDPKAGWEDEIRRRMELPRDQFIPLEDDTLFDELRAMIRAKKAENKGEV